ncbi:hypothetical protein BMS77_02150 [Leuconostoc pseudomesenteroides]|uniref:Uncharacterized protein n=1 Tax=Leuconostoc pseudomesenteroides TaxID=33968 RepID=A0A1X0VEL7_LEUPS|nr:hypothetical protein [Leuconostoc pseudomesenteroides]OQJ73343.1 hypothetical protein BMS77_02150 [Leuconostoc pseudomesenteroides]OQJ77545.1 hypothetical protein BMS83_01910 [Leuconostoc pseudomesenteroides]OQJ78200.1 hypothetical protein BMS82_03890 [Leuconostoc pseudomesenteroides]ORI37614.1 hypothetical protein BMR88_03675 [Leuconostoc pseudomesenteroides]ORI46001.1 hypothetical protein BMR94_04150 [Leuconostoc pseudomesenteroides]
MRTDTISRDDTQDFEIAALKTEVNYRVNITNQNIDSLDEKFKISNELFIKNQNNMSRLITDANSKINDLNRRLDRQSYALCLLFGIVIGLLAKVYFFN